jgi:hypothetical protein
LNDERIPKNASHKRSSTGGRETATS